MKLKLRFRPDVQVESGESERDVVVCWHNGRSPQQKPFSQLTDGMLTSFRYLANGGAERQKMYNAVIDHDGLGALLRLQSILRMLDAGSLLRHELQRNGRTCAELLPFSPYFRFRKVAIEPNQLYQLSRFACWRRVDAHMVLESPQGYATLQLHDSDLLRQLILLTSPQSLRTLMRLDNGLEEEAWEQLLLLLLNAGVLTAVNSKGTTDEDADPTLRQWQFHDLYFHARSRVGRQIGGYGDTYRFWGDIPSLPATKTINGERIPLAQPDLNQLMNTGMTLTQAMEQRHSTRYFDDHNPITLEQVGQLLFRVARIKELLESDQTRQDHTERLQLSRRAYPGGGARHGLELYLTVRLCAGLAAGFYYYDPLQHALVKVSDLSSKTERLMQMGTPLPGENGTPQILLTFSARFQRYAWKYEGVAYALALKECGVLYQSFYLVATSMALGVCGLGGGDADLFAQIAETDFYKESSIGEMALGMPLRQKGENDHD